MKIIIRVLVLIGWVMISGPDKVVAQQGDTMRLEVDLLGQSTDAVSEMPIEPAHEGNFKEDLAVQDAQEEKIPEPEAPKIIESSPPQNEAVSKEATTKIAPTRFRNSKQVKKKTLQQDAQEEKIPDPEAPKILESSPAKNERASKEMDSEESVFSSIGNTIAGWFRGDETETTTEETRDSEFEAGGKEDLTAHKEMKLPSSEDFPAFIQDIEIVDEQESGPRKDRKDMGTLSTAILDPTLGIETRAVAQTETEMLSTATLDPAPENETGQEEEDAVQAVAAEIFLEPDTEKEPSQAVSVSTQEFEVAKTQEPDSQKETETLPTGTLEPVPEIETRAVVQTPQAEKSPAERLQEKIAIVSQVTSSVDKQRKEGLANMKPVRKKGSSPTQENILVARVEPDTRKIPIHEEPVEGVTCVRSKKANLRNGPGKNYQKLAQVNIYTPFERLKKSGQWVKIKNFQDEIFWIYKTLLAEKYSCGTVAQDNVDFYIKPDFNSFPFYGAPMDTGFSVRILSLENENDWVKVMDSAENISWVQKSMLWIR